MDFSDLVRMFGYGASPDAGFSLPPDYSGLSSEPERPASQNGTPAPSSLLPRRQIALGEMLQLHKPRQRHCEAAHFLLLVGGSLGPSSRITYVQCPFATNHPESLIDEVGVEQQGGGRCGRIEGSNVAE